MTDDIRRLLQIICKLLNDTPPAPKKSIRGNCEIVNLRLTVRFSPNFKQFAKWDAGAAVRAKPTRLQLAHAIESELESVLVGYTINTAVELEHKI